MYVKLKRYLNTLLASLMYIEISYLLLFQIVRAPRFPSLAKTTLEKLFSKIGPKASKLYQNININFYTLKYMFNRTGKRETWFPFLTPKKNCQS